MSDKTQTNGQIMQSVLTDALFAAPEHVSDIKQVLEVMAKKGQHLREEQIRGLILLKQLGENKLLHPNGNPYKAIIDAIESKYKVAVVNPSYYLDTIEELVPKPPKPVILTDRGKPMQVGGR